MDTVHKKYMQRCIQLAENAAGQTYPNPLVGSVIVHDDKIIGEGFHKKAGLAHAEVEAYNSVPEDKRKLIPESTIYVNLEPCSHYGKTPPCSDLIIEKKFRRVVAGGLDPNPIVSGKGLKKIENAGIETIYGILENECRFLNRRFYTFFEKKRPFIILKWAQTQNAYFCPIGSEKKWITNKFADIQTHLWRSRENAILVGSNTVLIDNPGLNVRHVEGKDPIRIIFDPENSIPNSHPILNHNSKLIIFNHLKNNTQDNITYFKIDSKENFIDKALEHLYSEGIQSILVEGGKFTLDKFIDNNLWDEARIWIGDSNWDDGIPAPSLNQKTKYSTDIKGNTLQYFFNTLNDNNF